MSDTLMRLFGDYALISVPVREPFSFLGDIRGTKYSCTLKYKGETVDRASGSIGSESDALHWATGAILRHKRALESFASAAS